MPYIRDTVTGRLLSVLFVLATLAAAVTADTVETRPFAGVRHIAHAQTEPYPLAWHLVVIDLDTPGVRVTATRDNGADAPRDTWTETTRRFARRTGVQVAVNANFFVNDGKPHTRVVSLAAGSGRPYSAWDARYPHGVNISADNVVTFVRPATPNPTGFDCEPPVTLHNAVSGNARLVANGEDVAPGGDTRHPRTCIGIDRDGHLLLLVVDGRHAAHSRGARYGELAEILLAHEAVTAINLDGGGSTTLVFADPAPRVVNVPMPSQAPADAPLPPFPIERRVGNNLGVFAPPAEDGG